MSILTTVRAVRARANAGAGPDPYRHQLPLLDGGVLDLHTRRGYPTLVVNTASKCAYAKQFYGLQTVHARFSDLGLMVLGCPSSDFGALEFDSPDETKLFCEGLYEIEFVLTERMPVRFAPHPFWSDLAGMANSGPPVWNFTKYLLGGRGEVLGWWSTNVHPESPRITEAIEAALMAPTGSRR